MHNNFLGQTNVTVAVGGWPGPPANSRGYLGCAARQSSLEEQLSALVVGHGYLPIASAKITSYN